MRSVPPPSSRVHPMRAKSRAFVTPQTIGFLTDSFTDFYQLGLLQGALEAAQDRGIGLIAFAGRVPATPSPEDALVSSLNVEGLVVTAPTMAYRIGMDGLGQYVRGLGEMPVCFLGAQVPGLGSVLMDNRGGVEQAVRHLVRVHERRRIAFLRGTVGNAEADLRFGAYCETLVAEGLHCDEALVGIGDFVRHLGARAMNGILESGKMPDAVVCANDAMAFGAIDALRERGLKVPGDVAVVGFDDTEEGQFSVPLLTSVGQPLRKQAAEGVRVVFDALTQRVAPESVTLNLELVTRTSCGCEGELSGLTSTRTAPMSSSFELVLRQRRPLIVAEMARSSQAGLGRISPDWGDRLVDALIPELRGLGERPFLRALENELEQSRASRGQLARWHRIISVLRQETRAALGSNLAQLERAEDVFHAAREVVSREMEHAQASLRLSGDRWVRVLRESGIALGAARTFDDLTAALVESLERLGFRRAYVAVRGKQPGMSHLLLGWDRKLPLQQVPPPSFETQRLAPEGLLPRDEPALWAALPLTRGDQQLGHLLVDIGAGEGLVWEGLCQQVSLALELCCAAACREQ